MRAATLAARADVPNTSRAYGDSINYSSGIPKEWREWTQAGPGVVVFGLMTPPNKVVYNALVTPEKVETYLAMHLALRGKISRTGKVR